MKDSLVTKTLCFERRKTIPYLACVQLWTTLMPPSAWKAKQNNIHKSPIREPLMVVYKQLLSDVLRTTASSPLDYFLAVKQTIPCQCLSSAWQWSATWETKNSIYNERPIHWPSSWYIVQLTLGFSSSRSTPSVLAVLYRVPCLYLVYIEFLASALLYRVFWLQLVHINSLGLSLSISTPSASARSYRPLRLQLVYSNEIQSSSCQWETKLTM